MTWTAALIGMPLGAVLFWGVARILSQPLKSRLKDGPLKRFLFFSW